MSVQIKPTARQSQPTAFLGRLEAIRAPTSGKAKKRPPPASPPTLTSAFQPLGMSALRARNHSGKAATNTAKVSPASDQASHVEARVCPPPPPRSRSFVPSTTNTLQHHRSPIVTTTVTRIVFWGVSPNPRGLAFREVKRCMLVSVKLVAHFSRGCAHPAPRSRITVTRPPPPLAARIDAHECQPQQG